MPQTPRLPKEAAGLLGRAAAASREPVYLVGGAIRDGRLDRPVEDLDLAAARAKELSRALASELKATLVVLDDENAVYRLALPPGRWSVRQLDVEIGRAHV